MPILGCLGSCYSVMNFVPDREWIWVTETTFVKSIQQYSVSVKCFTLIGQGHPKAFSHWKNRFLRDVTTDLSNRLDANFFVCLDSVQESFALVCSMFWYILQYIFYLLNANYRRGAAFLLRKLLCVNVRVVNSVGMTTTAGRRPSLSKSNWRSATRPTEDPSKVMFYKHEAYLRLAD